MRDRWVPWLRALPQGTTVVGNGGSFWTRYGDLNGVSFWTSGLNTVSDVVLCKLHDFFEEGP